MTTVESVESPSEPLQGTFSEVFSEALRGHPTSVWGVEPDALPLPVHDWLRDATLSDQALLSHCRGATIDVGCGPGRMTAQLARDGHQVLAVDLVREAVHQARQRGVPALRHNVFEPMPGEGHWDTVLLADGNIGIGGDPVALLERVGDLVAPDGRIVVDLAPWGTGVVTRHVRLETSHGQSRRFPWTLVGADAVQAVAHAAGLGRASGHQHGDRVWAVIEARA